MRNCNLVAGAEIFYIGVAFAVTLFLRRTFILNVACLRMPTSADVFRCLPMVTQSPPFNFPSGRVVVLLRKFDKDGNGKLDIDEFADFYAEAKST